MDHRYLTRSQALVAREARRAEIADLYRQGKTLKEIGSIYGVTYQAIRKRLARMGISSDDGGGRFIINRRRSLAAAAKDEKYLRRYGCTYSQFKSLTPFNAVRGFNDQKAGAAVRGIGWELNLWQWWTLWQNSGHWAERGRGRGKYAMCRHGDDGPYAVGNIYIATNEQNIRDGAVNRGCTIKDRSYRYEGVGA